MLERHKNMDKKCWLGCRENSNIDNENMNWYAALKIVWHFCKWENTEPIMWPSNSTSRYVAKKQTKRNQTTNVYTGACMWINAHCRTSSLFYFIQEWVAISFEAALQLMI